MAEAMRWGQDSISPRFNRGYANRRRVRYNLARPHMKMGSLTPRLAGRAAVAAVVGVVAGCYCYQRLLAHPQLAAEDFTWPWRAARVLLDGNNPYSVIQPTGRYPFGDYFLYPLPAAVAVLPVAPFNAYVAGGVFFGASITMLAYALVRDGWWRLILLFSPSFLMAAWSVQWSPLIAAAALTPGLSFLAATKPNVGLASLAYTARWSAVAAAIGFGLLCLFLNPSWPIDWLRSLRAGNSHPAVLLWKFGFVGLLAAFRWRSREARLVLALTLVPAAAWWYDHGALGLVARTPAQGVFLLVCGWSAWILMLATQNLDLSRGTRHIEPFITLGILLPAAAVVLWQGTKATVSPPATGAER